MAVTFSLKLPQIKLPRFSPRPRVGVAIAGGGCKAFYGLGLFSRFQEFGLAVDAWAGTSAGASMALTLALRKVDEVMTVFTALTEINEKNLYISRLIQGKTPFPHERMYRTTVRKTIDWEQFQIQVKDIAIPVAKVPPDAFLSFPEGVKGFYELTKAYLGDGERIANGLKEKHLLKAAAKYGLTEKVFFKEDIENVKHLEDIILASSSIPPLMKFQKIGRERYLDGGIFANLPLQHLRKVDYRLGVVYDPADLINYEQYLDREDVFIFYPGKKVTVKVWEYSRPDLVEETFEMGRRDAEKTAETIRFLLE